MRVRERAGGVRTSRLTPMLLRLRLWLLLMLLPLLISTPVA